MLPEPFLSITIAFLFVVIPVNLGCQAQHFYLFAVRYLHCVHFYVCFFFTCCFFTHLHVDLFFFSVMFFFCAVIAFHCPCHLVDLNLFIVICIVTSIAAVLNLISMFHVMSNFMSISGFDVGLDRPVRLDHF